MARPAQVKANIDNLKKIALLADGLVDVKPTIAYVMKECGCTYSEIAKVFGINRGLAQYYVEAMRKALGVENETTDKET